MKMQMKILRKWKRSIENDSNLKIHDDNILYRCSPIKHTFNSPHTLLGFSILHPTRGMNIKENKITRNDVPYTKNDQSMPSFLLASQS